MSGTAAVSSYGLLDCVSDRNSLHVSDRNSLHVSAMKGSVYSIVAEEVRDMTIGQLVSTISKSK